MELINKFIGSFNALIQSIQYVLTHLAKLNDLTDSLNVIQDSIMELDREHDKDDKLLLFEENYSLLRTDMEDIIVKHFTKEATNSSHSSHISLDNTIRLLTI